VLAHAVGSIVDRGRNAAKAARLSSQTLVAIARGDEWRFVAFHNTRVRPITAGLRGLAAWMLADLAWSALGARGAARSRSALTCVPSANGAANRAVT